MRKKMGRAHGLGLEAGKIHVGGSAHVGHGHELVLLMIDNSTTDELNGFASMLGSHGRSQACQGSPRFAEGSPASLRK